MASKYLKLLADAESASIVLRLTSLTHHGAFSSPISIYVNGMSRDGQALEGSCLLKLLKPSFGIDIHGIFGILALKYAFSLGFFHKVPSTPPKGFTNDVEFLLQGLRGLLETMLARIALRVKQDYNMVPTRTAAFPNPFKLIAPS